MAGGLSSGIGTNGVLARTGNGFGVQSVVGIDGGYSFEASADGSTVYIPAWK